MAANAGEAWASRTFVIATALAPILLLASAIAFAINGEGQNSGEAGGILDAWSFIAYAVAIVGLTRILAERAPGAATILLVTGLVGAGGGVGYGIDAVQASIFANGSIQDTTSAAGPLALQLPGIMFPLTLLAIAVTLVRTGILASWPAYVLGLGAILFPIGNVPDIEAIAIASNVVLAVAGVGLAQFMAALGGAARPQPATG